MRRLIPLIVLAATLAGPALAQVVPYPAPYAAPPYAAYPGGRAAAIADQHRYETERLRSQAQVGAALARLQQQEAQLTRLEIQAARQQADSVAPPQPRPLYSPEQERALRQGAADRRVRTSEGVAQIDAWLDRPND